MSSDIQVQGSNDWSIASKLSTVNAGYYKDPFIKCFAEKMTKRSSLIHRGYYERFKAINHIFKEFLKHYPQGQVISFGAGFDSSFFRLRSEGYTQFHFVEIDFPDVVKKKELLIKQHSECTELASDSNIYTLLTGDLRDLAALNTLLLNSNISKTAPTLFFSECAITYMDSNSSDRLIEWCSTHFANAVFSVYEQIEPSDGFGLVMQRHFNQLSIPLLSLESYPDKYCQMKRFKSRGWTRCEVYDLNEFAQKSEDLLKDCPIWNQEGIQYLESFDEYEGLHAKCAHYIILSASKGYCALSLTTPSSPLDLNGVDALLLKECEFRSAYKSNCVNWELKVSTFDVISDSQSHQQTVRRYGQASCETPDGCLMLSGGFGVTDKGEHKRLNDLIVLHPNGVDHKQFELEKSKFNARMHHSMDFLSRTLVIFGGRTHPKNPLCDLILYPFITIGCQQDLHSFVYNDNSENYNIHPHPGRYRHASTTVEPSTLFICGGLFTQGKLLDDCWQLDLSDWFADKTKSPKWSKFASLPGGRHSASLSHWENQLILCGGLDKWEKVCSTQLLVANSTLGERSEWKQVSWNGPEPLPRYSHQTLVTEDNRLLLVGGTSSKWPSSPGVCIIQLGKWTCSEYCLPNQEIERPVMLIGHSAHLIRNDLDELFIYCWGGGGSCFSFGTHFNTVNVRISLPSN